MVQLQSMRALFMTQYGAPQQQVRKCLSARIESIAASKHEYIRDVNSLDSLLNLYKQHYCLFSC